MASRYGTWTQLRILRQRSGIRTLDLATAAGISRPHLTNLENGTRWPTRTITIALADALDCPIGMIEREPLCHNSPSPNGSAHATAPSQTKPGRTSKD